MKIWSVKPLSSEKASGFFYLLNSFAQLRLPRLVTKLIISNHDALKNLKEIQYNKVLTDLWTQGDMDGMQNHTSVFYLF